MLGIKAKLPDVETGTQSCGTSCTHRLPQQMGPLWPPKSTMSDAIVLDLLRELVPRGLSKRANDRTFKSGKGVYLRVGGEAADRNRRCAANFLSSLASGPRPSMFSKGVLLKRPALVKSTGLRPGPELGYL